MAGFVEHESAVGEAWVIGDDEVWDAGEFGVGVGELAEGLDSVEVGGVRGGVDIDGVGFDGELVGFVAVLGEKFGVVGEGDEGLGFAVGFPFVFDDGFEFFGFGFVDF